MSRIEGLDELLATLSMLGGDIKQSAKKGLGRGAKRIQKNAKLLAPVDTGQLRNSIKTKTKTTSEGVEAKVYTNVEHAVYNEFGTGVRGASSHTEKPEGANISYNSRWMGMSPRPFLTPAYLHAKNIGEVEQEVVKSIQQDIRKLGGK